MDRPGAATLALWLYAPGLLKRLSAPLSGLSRIARLGTDAPAAYTPPAR